MSGTGKIAVTVAKTGDSFIDGVLSGYAWKGSVTYAFPTSTANYAYNGIYDSMEISDNFGRVSSKQVNAALFAMETSFGNSANDGFSVEGFTNLSFSRGSASTASLRFAQSDTPSPTAWAYYPGNLVSSGDIWFSTYYSGTPSLDYKRPVAGNYAWHTLLHELGHALGLKHGNEAENGFGAMPSQYDTIEYTVMTYRGYVGGTVADGYQYEDYGAPQTFMMADIAALQEMYGADYTTNKGNTIYKWKPNSGDTLVNGKVAIDAGANRIFATIWDGGGKDTYDLSTYKTDVVVDLRPGGASVFSEDQLAFLDGKTNDGYASANIYNALMYENSTKSLIENARGGSGDDVLYGNQVANKLVGNRGDDILFGGLGADDLYGGKGADTFLYTAANESRLRASARDTIFDFSGKEGDLIDLSGIDASTKVSRDQAFDFIGTDAFSGTAGELRYVKKASDTYIYADTNGDKKIDFAIHLDDAVSLQAGFFVL